MRVDEFEQLLIDADLHPHQASRNYGIAFGVSLHVPTEIASEYGIIRSFRHQCDWLVYQPSAFSKMTRIEAERQIGICKASLARAAKTKQGTLAGGRENQ